MPEEPNHEHHVPPLKVLRKRLDGVYRSDGLSGPTRRYVLIVALLVGLASLPTLAAITIGSRHLNESTTGALEVPFLPVPSGPARASASEPVSQPASNPAADPSSNPASRPSPSASVPPAWAGPAPARSTPAAVGPGIAPGQAEPQMTKPKPSREEGYGHSSVPSASSDDRPRRHASPSRPSTSGGSDRSPSLPSGSTDAPGKSHEGPGRSGSSPGRSADEPGFTVPIWRSASPAKPGESDRPADNDDPLCHERGDCDDHPSHHHRPSSHDDSSQQHRPQGTQHQPCADADTHADADPDADADVNTDADADADANANADADADVDVDADADVESDADADDESVTGDGIVDQLSRTQIISSTVHHRSSDRSDSRRSAVTERPQNSRPSSRADRTDNGGHHHDGSRRDEDRGASRSYGVSSSAGSSYRGSHRAEHMARAEDTGSIAHQRNSRVGRHHGDQRPGHTSRRWEIA